MNGGENMEKCPKCNGSIVLWKDAYDRFEHFFECTKCKSRFWMGNSTRQTRELTSEENFFIEGYINSRRQKQ